MDNQDLTREISRLLGMIDPSRPYGTELFHALCRLTITPCIEAVCLQKRFGNAEVDVLMTKRAATESAYPGEWHCPGTALRPGESFKDALKRVARTEFRARLTKENFVTLWDNLHEARGHFHHFIYLCELGPGPEGIWFPADPLPSDTDDFKIISGHRSHVIPVALAVYKKKMEEQ